MMLTAFYGAACRIVLGTIYKGSLRDGRGSSVKYAWALVMRNKSPATELERQGPPCKVHRKGRLHFVSVAKGKPETGEAKESRRRGSQEGQESQEAGEGEAREARKARKPGRGSQESQGSQGSRGSQSSQDSQGSQGSLLCLEASLSVQYRIAAV